LLNFSSDQDGCGFEICFCRLFQWGDLVEARFSVQSYGWGVGDVLSEKEDLWKEVEVQRYLWNWCVQVGSRGFACWSCSSLLLEDFFLGIIVTKPRKMLRSYCYFFKELRYLIEFNCVVLKKMKNLGWWRSKGRRGKRKKKRRKKELGVGGSKPKERNKTGNDIIHKG